MKIKLSEHKSRRAELMRMMGEGAVAIISSASEHIRNRDAHYPFRQDSDFFYLSGFPEPDAVMVLMPGRENGEYILFCREKDPLKETWDGYRAGQSGAVDDYDADDSFPIDDIDDILPGMLERCDRVLYTMGAYPEFDARVLGWVNQLRKRSRSGTHVPSEFVALEHCLHDMRLFKTSAEIKMHREAIEISTIAHCRAMQNCKPGMMEYQVEAEFAHEFRKHNTRDAYTPIVAGGGNACVLHYVENNDKLKSGDLLLIDAGCEMGCYASDITRTFPVNGTFSVEQRKIYELVLDAQLAAIAQTKPGNHWDEPHMAAVKVLTRGLVELGLLSGDVEALIEAKAYQAYYMHRTGHWLGMDVHDVGDYKVDDLWRELEVGMLLTVEPGLYIAEGSDCDERWWNIGVRIEDDVLVTAEGCEVLSAAVPKTVAEVEAQCASLLDGPNGDLFTGAAN